MSGSPGSATWRYPDTDRDEVAETLHGVEITDPYRWLEDPFAARTREWVTRQNEFTGAHLTSLAARPFFAERLAAILGAPRASAPSKRAGRYLRSYNDGSAQLDTVHIADDLPGLLAGGRVLLDPAEFDPDGKVSISQVSVSPDGRLAAYGRSEAGSDWIEWWVREVDTGTDLPDRLTHSKFSPATWLPDSGGFLYWSYPDQGPTSGEDAAALGVGMLRRHRLGTDQADDEVVFHEPSAPRERASPHVTDDDRWVIMTITSGTARKNRVAARRINPDGSLGPQLDVVPEPDALYEYSGADADRLYLRTDLAAPRSRLLAVDLAALEAGRDEPWPELVAQRPEVLTSVTRAGDGFLALYLDDAQHRVYQLARSGERLRELPLAQPMSVVSWSTHPGDDEAFVGITSFLAPTRSYRVDLSSGAVEVLALDAAGDPGGVTTVPALTERWYATSNDGTQVPYTLLRRADAPAGASLPTILYGYGGFNIPVLPAFRAAWAAWIEAGGALAVANLRGGGEFGRDWYEAGTRERKQNVFDDFVAVGEHLVATGATTREQLALHGGSNGGLLVGAVMTQRPDLAAVALPIVGVMDMLRFHRFTIGWAWIPDYGDPDDPDDFAVLRAYSPLHNLRAGEHYPATLVLTGDHDDRVVPAHSHKFAATLQRAHAGPAPVLVRIETATGHGLGKPRRAQIAETADLLAFAAEHTGLVPAK